MTRFTLQPGRWYAMTLLGDEFDASAMCSLSPSPIRIDRVAPLKTGDRNLDLAFFHANYPEGVRDKMYRLKVIYRGVRGLLARSTEHDPPRFIYITEITDAWLRHNFPGFHCIASSPQESLNRAFRPSQSTHD